MSAQSETYVSAHLMLREAYDLTYGISTEEEVKNPLSIMMMHPHEDFVTDGAVMSLMDRIINAKLPALTNMSLVELMELPTGHLEHLLDIGRRNVESDNAAADQFVADLDNQ